MTIIAKLAIQIISTTTKEDLRFIQETFKIILATIEYIFPLTCRKKEKRKIKLKEK